MIRNLTPHLIRLAPSPDPATWLEIPSSGRAVLATTPGAPQAVVGCPVPVMGSPTYGEISGLPEHCDEGDLLIVAFPVAQRVPVVLAKLALDREAAWGLLRKRPITGQEAGDLTEKARRIDERITVLRCVVALGTGPQDGAIRWTQADADAGLCPVASVGTPRAVTRLVRP